MQHIQFKVFLIACVLMSARAIDLQDRIKHVIVVMEENRSFDHLLGFLKGVNGLTGKETNPLNTSDPHSAVYIVTNMSKQIGPCDPNHGLPATTNKIFGMNAVKHGNLTDPAMIGFIEQEAYDGNAKRQYCGVMDMFTPEGVPVITALAQEFVLMDRWFASVPGPTWPNRLFALAATSGGLTETFPWYKNIVGDLYPMRTIMDQVSAYNGTWRNYYNDTPWELFIASIAHNPENTVPVETFFEDARTGNLPTFAWINPRCGANATTGQGSNDHHPDHDVALGEAFYKDIYEALRASPQWNETLMILTYDEHGGFYDHVPTPLNVPAPDDGSTPYPDNFGFDRLGIRIPTVLISPWLPKGVVVSNAPDAQKPQANSEYDLTSIMATMRKLLRSMEGSPPLTKRDAWSSTFEHLFTQLDSPRTDCPLHLPDPLPPSHGALDAELSAPVNGLQQHIMAVHARHAGVDFPDHIPSQRDVSEWLRAHFDIHRAVTAEWKASKASPQYRVVVQPLEAASVGKAWTVHKPVPPLTFSTVTVAVQGTNLCLDGGDLSVGSNLTVSVCYPTAEPNKNNDRSQQWVYAVDGSVRPYADQSLCVTNDEFQGKTGMISQPTLQVCDNRLGQHYTYNDLQFGCGISGWALLSV